MDTSTLLLQGSARAIGAAIATGRLTSVAATRWYLERIARFNDGPGGINAVRQVSTTALEQAAAADRELAAGSVRGPLHGVPYLAKDNIFTLAGLATAAGAQALNGYTPPYAATVIRRLDEAGAVLLGKANLTEFADFVSDVMPSEFSGAGGVVRNPLGFRYDRGQGSSVGSAAAVAARFCAFALGSETQNSIQTPASVTSVTGFKPTVGRVSRHGVVPLVPSQDSPGPLALCVNDAALVLQAIEGADVRDTATLALAQLSHGAGRPAIASLVGVRIGVPRRCVADLTLTPDQAPALERVLRALSGAGAIIIDPCDFPQADALHQVRSSVFRTEFKASLDNLLAALRPRGFASLRDLIAWNTRHPEAIPYGQSLLEAAAATQGLQASQYVEDRQLDVTLSLDGGILGALAAGNADVLLSPMSAAAKCTGKAGAPVLALPAGRDRTGTPFGITLFAEPGADQRLLDLGALIEPLIGGRLMPAPD
ncbi:MAG: amidase family protein [Pigmentiphaga sp.]